MGYIVTVVFRVEFCLHVYQNLHSQGITYTLFAIMITITAKTVIEMQYNLYVSYSTRLAVIVTCKTFCVLHTKLIINSFKKN